MASLPTLTPIASAAHERLASIEWIASDVDGTLTCKGRLAPRLLDAIARLHALGIRLVPISGRPAGEVLGLCRYLPFVEFAVAENGLLEIVADRAPRWLETPTNLERLLAVGEHLNREHDARLVRTGDAFCRIGDVAYERESRDERELVRLRELAGEQGVHLVWSNVHVHLAERKPDKGAGLLAVLAQRGIDPATVATAGDAPNDAGLFVPGRFGLTFGTVDVVGQREWFEALPEFVAGRREIDGFLELVEALVAARSR
jgi:hypothetical protein